MRHESLFVPVVGTESEYGMFADYGKQYYGDESAVSALAGRFGQHVLDGYGVHTKLWLPNGGLLYRDIGEHLEYATPECLTPAELAVYEWVGVWLLNRLFRENAAKSPALYRSRQLAVIKNNTARGHDTPYESFGSHLNVQVPLPAGRLYDDELRALANALAGLIVALPLVVGAGLAYPRAYGRVARLGNTQVAYRLSARSHFMREYVGTVSMRAQRSMFLRRTEHHAGPGSWRLQIIGLDANVLPEVIELKAGIIMLMVMLWAAGELEPLPVVEPLLSLRQVSLDCFQPVQLQAGRTLLPWQMLDFYYQQAARFVRRHQLTMFNQTLVSWRRQLMAFAHCGDAVPTELVGHNDWVTKWAWLQRHQQRHGSLNTARAEQISARYHAVPLGDQFEASVPRRLMERYGDPAFWPAVLKAAETPPASRAAVRSAFVALLRRHIRLAMLPKMDWTELRLGSHSIELPDPHNPDTTPVDDLARLLGGG